MPYAHFHLSLVKPEGTSTAELREYVDKEVRAGVGQYHPEDPIFHLDRKSVRVMDMGTSEKRRFDEGSYESLSAEAKKEDHRLLDMENSNLRKIILWLAREQKLPKTILDELSKKVHKTLEEGGVLDTGLDDELADLGGYAEAADRVHNLMDTLVNNPEAAKALGKIMGDQFMARFDAAMNVIAGYTTKQPARTLHELLKGESCAVTSNQVVKLPR